jgi:hypothetical protein
MVELKKTARPAVSKQPAVRGKLTGLLSNIRLIKLSAINEGVHANQRQLSATIRFVVPAIEP